MTDVEEHPKPGTTRGFYAAALYNVLAFVVFSRLLTNDYLASLEPHVFSRFEWVGIVLWGCAYAAVATTYHRVPRLLGVFVLEKMCYAAMWLAWLIQHGSTLPDVYSRDAATGVLLTVYGAGDFAFGLFFLWVARGTRLPHR